MFTAVAGADCASTVEFKVLFPTGIVVAVGAGVGRGTRVVKLLVLYPGGRLIVVILMDMKLQDPAVKDDIIKAPRTVITSVPLDFDVCLFQK